VRICSLLPSGTEILFALGLGDQIIGVTDLCDYPPAALDKRIVCRSRIDPSKLSSEEVEAEMHRILAAGESPYDLDVAWLRSAAPDVVLTQDLCYFCEVDAGTVGRAIAPIAIPPRMLNLNPRTLDEILDSFLEIGRACQSLQRANQLVDSLRARIDAVVGALADVSHRPAVFSLEGVNPLVIGGHWVTDLMLTAGGRLPERFAPGCPAERIEWGEVVAAAPDKLYVDLCSSDLERGRREIPWLAAQPGWNELPAVRSGEVYLIDHSTLSRPGPRIVDGLEAVAQLTHPDRFSGCIPDGMVLKLDRDVASKLPTDRISDAFYPWPADHHSNADSVHEFVAASGISDTSRV
jgi:iron complex transport system substrate-binding protein